jgi:hypothetical protein
MARKSAALLNADADADAFALPPLLPTEDLQSSAGPRKSRASAARMTGMTGTASSGALKAIRAPRKSARASSASASKPAREKRPPRGDLECRKKAFDDYRSKCYDDETGCRSSLLEQCKAFGVGGDLWPDFRKWNLDQPEFDAIGAKNVGLGKRCMTDYMWNDPTFQEQAQTACPDDPVFAERLALFNKSPSLQQLYAPSKHSKHSKPSKSAKSAKSAKSKSASGGAQPRRAASPSPRRRAASPSPKRRAASPSPKKKSAPRKKPATATAPAKKKTASRSWLW